MPAIKILSLIPPMTQLNTPYPSTAYLTGFLRSQKIDAAQDDLALKLVLALLSKNGLVDMRAAALALPEEARSASINFFLDYFQRYQRTIEPTLPFCRGGIARFLIASPAGAFCRKGHASVRWMPMMMNRVIH